MSTRQILTLNNLISIALNPFLEPISTKQCLLSFLFKETTRVVMGFELTTVRVRVRRTT